MFLNEIQSKRSTMVESQEIIDIQKKIKEDKIKKNLEEQRRIISVMAGVEPTRKPMLSENMLISTTSSKNTKYSRKNLNEIGSSKSNMFQAISNAQQK